MISISLQERTTEMARIYQVAARPRVCLEPGSGKGSVDVDVWYIYAKVHAHVCDFMCIYIYTILHIIIYIWLYYIYVLLFLISGSGDHSSSLVNINHQQVSSILVHCDQLSSGWWLSHPSEKYEFVSWDHDIPNWMESHKIHVPYISIPPTSQWIIIQFHFVDLGSSGIWLVDHMETPVANPRGWDLPAHATSHDHFLASQARAMFVGELTIFWKSVSLS